MHTSVHRSIGALATIFSLLAHPTWALPQNPDDLASSGAASKPDCRYLPGDAGWPQNRAWDALNKTVGGKLIRAQPLGSACFGPHVNSDACANVKADWTQWSLFTADPVTIMSPLWLNNSCNPYNGPDGACGLGNMASYAIEIHNADDAAAGIKFAQKNNIRLTIKNTGHDYLGRSAGQGALALWTHKLQDKAALQYKSRGYNGPAVRIGAGVQFGELYQWASDHGLRVTGGGCPTVGAAGAYRQGGGHGLLASKYGMGSDSTLEFEVVTADGKKTTASPEKNADLYWALSGGGGGTYATVISVTLKAYRDGPVSGFRLAVSNTEPEKFWAGVAAWLRHSLTLDRIDGLSTFWSLTNESFTIIDTVLPDRPTADLQSALGPFHAELRRLGLEPALNETRGDANWIDHFQYFLNQNTYDTNVSISGRLVPRRTVRDELPALTATLRSIVDDAAYPGAILSFIGLNVTHARVGNRPETNAVLPAWRDALLTMTVGLGFPATNGPAALAAGADQLQRWQDRLRAATPGAGAYVNEATATNPTWKEDYYGANYARLRAVKAKYDPRVLFWGLANVGSDDYWTPAADGRLCRVKA